MYKICLHTKYTKKRIYFTYNKIIIKCRHNLIKTKTLSVNVSLSWYIILEGGQNMKALIQKYISWMRKINSFISWKNGQTIC